MPTYLPSQFTETPTRIEYLEPIDGITDDLLIIFASPEERCLGIARKIERYNSKHVALIAIADEPNEKRNVHLNKLTELCRRSSIHVFNYKHTDSVYGVSDLAAFVNNLYDGLPLKISIDISTFPRNSLMLTLAAIERLKLTQEIRLLYSEPQSYQHYRRVHSAFGLKTISVIPSFVAPQRPVNDVALILFLGHERDRAMGMWQSIEPNKTIAVIPYPSYHPEWEGLSERLNGPLISGLPVISVQRVDPRNPIKTYELLCKVCTEFGDGYNINIAPLGTKPQSVGVYAFMREFPDAATAMYTSPIEFEHAYISSGVGDAWVLPFPTRKMDD
jgi:hypothetical protein